MHESTSLLEPRPQQLGRPRLPADQLRTEELRLYLTIPERTKLDEDARAAGMSPARYLRKLIAGQRPATLHERAGHTSNARLLLELNAIGNNLNQAMRDVHAGSTRQHDWEQLRVMLQAALEKVVFDDVR